MPVSGMSLITPPMMMKLCSVIIDVQPKASSMSNRVLALSATGAPRTMKIT